MVFSSSATVYGQPEKIPCVEDFKLQAMNPYGRTKVAISLFWVTFFPFNNLNVFLYDLAIV